MAIQGRHKIVMTGHINFEDHLLIKRQRACKKMNATGERFKPGNCRKQFVFIVRSCVHFQSFGVHSNMSAENAIEKLQIIAREKEAQRSEHKQRQ
jgi:hypothetical protein